MPDLIDDGSRRQWFRKFTPEH